jgi:maleylacetate reductase
MTGPEAARRAFVHQLPDTRVVFGAGTRHRLAEHLAGHGWRRALLIGGSDPLAAIAAELADQLDDTLAGRIDDIHQHVPSADADAALVTAAQRTPDCLVAVGGGSTIGLAKIIALETGLPIVALPTTYAGSEMTDIWGRTDAAGKTTGRDPSVRPRLVLYDVELTLGMPAELTAVSGLNALAHAVEAAYDAQASPVIHLMAAEAARVLATALPRAATHGENIDARTETLYGVWLAATALGSARMGVHHALCHVLGGLGLPHAETHAVVLPYAIAFNQPAARDWLTPVDRALGVPAGGTAAAVWDLGAQLKAPRSLRDLGLTTEQATHAAATLAARSPANPRPIDTPGARDLVDAAMRGERPASRGSIGTGRPTL